jgi:glucose-1-phosphate cytidylyltransferase
MKVVLFCGGLGTRLRDYSDSLPKPLVPIGYRPILWHVMKYYAHFGHKDFILCLGYKADKIKEYFLNYNEYASNDFTMTNGGKDLALVQSDIQDWKITFVDTGMQSNIGMRLMMVRKYLEGEEMFLANYSDGLTDINLNDMIGTFTKTNMIASMVCPVPSQTFHVVHMGADNLVQEIKYVRDTNIIVNGGYFILRKEIFDHIQYGEELVIEPFQRLIQQRRLMGFRHSQYWAMDTFKEQQELTDMYNGGNAPWELWRKKFNPELDKGSATVSDGRVRP